MSFSNQNPHILVIAGPNGSGKSTITRSLPLTGVYVNADDIKKARGCSDLEAAQMADKIRNQLMESGKDFSFETVLSTDRNLDLLRRAKSKGYVICAVFVLTHDSDINVLRVKSRVCAGGHDVPEDKIRSRYNKSLANIAALVRIANFTRIVDNTTDEPQLICEVEGTAVKIFESEVWSKQELLALLARQ